MRLEWVSLQIMNISLELKCQGAAATAPALSSDTKWDPLLGCDRVSWLLFPSAITLNAIHIFNKLGITLGLALVTICAVVWARYWGVYSAIITPWPAAHRVKGLLLRWCTESLTGVVILGRLSLPLQQGKGDTRAHCVTWLMDMWIAPYDLWYHLHCLAWQLPSAAVEGQCFPV